MEEKKLIKIGFRNARRITKYYAKTFYFASRLLPKDKRIASYSIYAICRLSDESVDSLSPEPKINNLERIQKNIALAFSNEILKDPLLLAFRQTINKYQIPKEYFDELIQGMYMDLNKARYSNFEELYLYCYRVAGVIGLIMLEIFGYDNESAKIYATDLGIAMQLTNILRDINEDLKRNRIYLPQDELTKYSITEKMLKNQELNSNFKSLIQFQIQRTRGYYSKSQSGIKLIKNKRSRLVILCMKEMYAAILDDIEKSGYDIFTKRAHLSLWGKIKTLLKIIIKRKYE